MARPKQDGLRYFSFDTDFFYADRRIKTLRARYGCDGVVIYIYLLTEIYRNGYYIRWDEDAEDNMMADLNLTEGLIKQVMEYLVSRSLLTKISILADPVTVITSPGIQKRYQEAVKGLKRDVPVDREIWLLKDTETASYIKFIQNYGKSEKNDSKSEKNDSKSEKNETKEKKLNEIKRNNPSVSPFTRFEDFARAYPKDIKNRYMAEQSYMHVLNDNPDHLTEEDLIIAAENYADAVCILGTDDGYVKQAQNWLKDYTFEQYLDANYTRPKPQKDKKNAFGDYKQNRYDFDALEKALLAGNSQKNV